MKVRVWVWMKDGVLDAEMAALQRQLARAGNDAVGSIERRQAYDLHFKEGVTVSEAEALAERIAEEVLVNPEIHDWAVERV